MLPWLANDAEKLADLIRRGQLPHALLLHGPPGTGRRWLALWLTSRLLNLDSPAPDAWTGGPLEPDSIPAHPDLIVLQPPAEKRFVPIDRVREMIRALQLTSHQKGAKVALVFPAEALTHQAANSLLKTLEEPPAGSCIILVTDALSRLPPTVVSRCHRLRVNAPPREQSMAWLQARRPDPAWETVLDLAGDAPLLALDLDQAGFAAQAHDLEADLGALRTKQRSGAEVARRWAHLDQDLCLRWLYQRIATEIRDSAADLGNKPLQSRGKSLTMHQQFAFLRDVGVLRRLRGTGLNTELQLANLLTRISAGADAG